MEIDFVYKNLNVFEENFLIIFSFPEVFSAE